MAIFAALCCSLVILLLLALHTPPARRFALDRLTSLLAAQQIALETDELSYNLFTLSLGVRNISIRSSATPDAPVFATVGRARIRLSLSRLLRGRYVIRSGAADDVSVHYVVSEDGRDNAPRPPSDPDHPSKPLDYLIAQLSMANARVRYENHAADVDVTMPLSSIEVRGADIIARHEVRFEGAAGQLRTRDRATSIDRITGQVDLGADDVNIQRLAVDAIGSHAELVGSIRSLASLEADLALKADVDSTQVASLAQISEPLAGRVAIDARAKGRLPSPILTAHVSSSAFRFRDVDAVQVDAVAAYDMTRRRAEVSSLQLDAPWGRVRAHGSASLDGDVMSQLDADVRGVDLLLLMRALRLPYAAATRVDATVRAEWPGLEYLRASGQADATLTATSATSSRGVIPVAGRVSARGDGARVVAELQKVTTVGADVTGRVAVTKDRELDGRLHGRASDIARAAASIETFLGRARGSLLPAPVVGAAAVDARLGGTLGAPGATAMVDAPALRVGQADGVALNAEVGYGADAVAIRRAAVTWRQAQANLAGRIALAGARGLDLSFNAENMDLPSLLGLFNQSSVQASGALSATGNIEGTASAPVANITLRGADLVAYEEPIGALDAALSMTAHDVTVSSITIDKPQPDGNGRISATAAFNVDRRTYTFDLRSQDLRLLGLVLPGGERLRSERVQLAARGSGSLASPAGALTLAIDSLELDDVDRAAPSQLGRVTVTADVANQQASIKASADRFNVDVDARVGVALPWPATVTVRAENLDVAALPLQGAAPLDGRLRATLQATADLATPARGTAALDVDAFSGSWNGQPFSVVAPARLRYERERLEIERLELTARDSSLIVRGALPLTEQAGTGDIAVEAHANLATLSQYVPEDAQIAGDGALTITGSIRGTLQAIDPDLAITVENGLVLSLRIEPGLSNVRLRAHVGDGEANIEQLTAAWGTATIDASGRVPLDVLPDLPVEIPRKGGPTTFTVALHDLNPAAIPGAPSGLGGRISLDAQMTSSRADLGALDGRITFPQLELSFNGLDLAQQQPSSVSIASGSATVNQLRLSGSAGSIAATGTAALLAPRAVDLNVDGRLDVGAISMFTDKVRAEGDAALKLAARGTLDAPLVNGTIDVTDVVAQMDEPGIAAENLTAHLYLDGRRVSLTQLSADVNGGSLSGSGGLTLGAGGLSDVDLQFTTDDFAFDAPLDLRSVSDSAIHITSDGDEIVVGGQVTLDEAGLTGDINFDAGLLAAMTAPGSLDLTEERNPVLERVRFNIDVDSATPVIVDNNLARAEVEVDLRLVGTPYEPGLTGRIAVLEGGEITLNERRYEAQRGVITFVDERRIQPSFDLLLAASAGAYDVTIAVTGEPGKTETTLTSDPTLPEPDILALLVTGRTLDEMRGEEFEVAREQVLSYLSGRVGSKLGRGIENATGLSEVRIEPNLIANETDPTARLTIGQDLTDELKFVYSTNLTDSSDQIWVAEYDVTRRLQTRGVRQSDNSYRLDFHHDVRFGGEPARRRLDRHQPTITELVVTSDGGPVDPLAADRFKVKQGNPYDFFAIRKGVQRVEELYVDKGHLQSRVRLTRAVQNDAARLTLRVTPGPLVHIAFDGAAPPRSVEEEVRTRWRRGVFDKQRADDGADALRAWLMRADFLQPKVDYRIDDAADGSRRVAFHIQQGPKYEKVVLAFEGAAGIKSDTLDSIVDQQHLERQLFTDPIVVTELLRRYYREQGYLAAEIDAPRYEFHGVNARVVVAVREGLRFTVGALTIAGNTVFSTDLLTPQLPIAAGGPYVPAAAEQALAKVRDVYWHRGYNDVRADYTLVLDRAVGRVNVALNIIEGRQALIADIAVHGAEKTSERLVREQLELSTAQSLDLSALARSRRNLYDTGAFSIVDITREELETRNRTPATTADAGGEATPEDGDATKAVRVNVWVREVQPFQLTYGASYDTERGVGGIFDLSNHNSLGKARVVGVRGRYDGQVREGRVYASQPALKFLPLKTTGSLYFREERSPSTEITRAFDVSRKGASVQQEKEMRNSYVWSYGYRYERARTLTPTANGVLDQTVTVSPLTSTLTRETRDDVLDAMKGAFLSQAFAYSPGWLGSDLPYVKYLGQYFHYFPLRPPQRKPLTNEILRPRLVYAVGIRIGLAQGLGGVTPQTERFFAGGSTTLRGFAQNAVGPIVNGVPTGGDALFLFNTELRAPLVSIVDGVVFADIGNVFARASDFSLTDLRESAGIGLRVRTPWFLLRGDYGFVLDRRSGERRSRIYFSIGQAF